MPFCKELVFENKPEGSSVLQSFSWDGNKYNSLLSKSAEDDLLIAINEITRQHTKIYTGQTEEHFFKVKLIDYSDEIEALINSKDFDFRLKRILPLKYEDSFSAKDVIHKHYREFMGDSLERFEYEVYLDNEKIYKPYDARCILESDIVFWDLSFEKESDEVPGDKIGVLWFTFNRKVTTNSENTPRGIYVRSKNMMLGNEYAIADSMTRLSSDYVATYRELTQTLNGVYGELLIDTERLSDNARRDWFKIDKSSNELKIILTDFLRKLKAYRYAASKAFNHKQDKTKKQVIEAYRNLTGGFNIAEFEKNFTDMTPEPVTENIFLYADDDIPRHSMTSKKFYETIIIALRQYCLENKGVDGIDELIKIRTFLKKYLNE
jgi:molecular chaperone HtpG